MNTAAALFQGPCHPPSFSLSLSCPLAACHLCQLKQLFPHILIAHNTTQPQPLRHAPTLVDDWLRLPHPFSSVQWNLAAHKTTVLTHPNGGPIPTPALLSQSPSTYTNTLSFECSDTNSPPPPLSLTLSPSTHIWYPALGRSLAASSSTRRSPVG
ncbi:hypothetical protein LX36DRAFT_185506 [Colletotrichum falcatum]|nr:hypothetical protein LX36DRAFT_185506 [Colletotrichum falcatum]